MKSQAPPRSAPTTSSFSPCPVMISVGVSGRRVRISANRARPSIPGILMSVTTASRSEEHTSELQSQSNLVCRLLLEKKNKLEQRRVAVLSEILYRIYEVFAGLVSVLQPSPSSARIRLALEQRIAHCDIYDDYTSTST